jgi:hypothetical protein
MGELWTMRHDRRYCADDDGLSRSVDALGAEQPLPIDKAIHRYISGHDALMRTLVDTPGKPARRAEQAAADAFSSVMHAVAKLVLVDRSQG